MLGFLFPENLGASVEGQGQGSDDQNNCKPRQEKTIFGSQFSRMLFRSDAKAILIIFYHLLLSPNMLAIAFKMALPVTHIL
jgi:hypothetical protein